MGPTKFLFLPFLLFLLNIQHSSPSSIDPMYNLVATLRRRLLEVTKFSTLTPDNTHLKLCDTDVCDARRPNGPLAMGECDRWARGDSCPDEQIFHVQGDPGKNDKAEMFFNLRSPFNGVSCEKGTCTPSLGATYNVFVAEGCIPERDYISEMQDTSNRVSKQVKIYLRRSAEFYITVQRIPGVATGPKSNCSFGLTVGSIEAQSDTARCFAFRRVKRGEAALANVPNCREVMPQYQNYVPPDTSAQTTFVVALIGLGVLVLSLCVLGGVLLRRWSRRKVAKAKGNDWEFEGVTAGTGNVAFSTAPQPAQTNQGIIVVDVRPPEPKEMEMPRRKPPSTKGVHTKEDRRRVEERMRQLEEGADDDDYVDGGELGARAGVLAGRASGASMQFKRGKGGSLLVMGADSRASDRPGSGSSGSAGSLSGRGSPADELYRSRRTGRLMPGSPGGSRIPTPPEGSAKNAAPRRRGDSVAGSDVGIDIKSSTTPDPEWEDGTGIRIDDILAQARGAAAAVAGGKGTPNRSRAWKSGEQPQREFGKVPIDRGSPALNSSGSSGSGDGAANGAAATRQGAPQPRPAAAPATPAALKAGWGEGTANGAATRQEPALGRQAMPPNLLRPSPTPANAATTPLSEGKRPPVMAPLMAARLGIKPQEAIGGRKMATIGSRTAPKTPSQAKTESSATNYTPAPAAITMRTVVPPAPAAAETAAQRAQHDLLANYDKKLEEAGLARLLAAAAASNDAVVRARLIAEHELRVAQMDARAAVARGMADEALQKTIEDRSRRKNQMHAGGPDAAMPRSQPFQSVAPSPTVRALNLPVAGQRGVPPPPPRPPAGTQMPPHGAGAASGASPLEPPSSSAPGLPQGTWRSPVSTPVANIQRPLGLGGGVILGVRPPPRQFLDTSGRDGRGMVSIGRRGAPEDSVIDMDDP